MIYFLYGEDAFRSAESMQEIKNKFLANNQTGSGLTVIDASRNGRMEKKNIVFEIKNALGSQGLFFSKRLVIVRQFLETALSEEGASMVNFLEQEKNIFDDKDVVLLFWEAKDPDSRKKITKFLLEKSKSQKFEKLKGSDYKRWILLRLQRINPEVLMPALVVNKFIGYVGENSAQAANELEKLATFKVKGEINTDDVDLLVKASATATIFETIEALSSGNKSQALALFHQQIEKGEDPFYVLAMYEYQIRNLLKIGECVWDGNSNQYAIAKLTGLNPYVVQKGLMQVKNFSVDGLKAVFLQLQEVDVAVKTGKAPDIILALDKFIINFQRR
jgi:DNA polymerase-3 subunit delta